MAEEFDVVLNEGMRDFLISKMSVSDEQKAFSEFSEARLSGIAIYLAMTIIVFFVVFFYTSALLYASSRESESIVLVLLLTIVFRIPVFIFVWIVKKQMKITPFRTYLSTLIPYCENFSSLTSTLSIGLSMFARLYNGKCTNISDQRWNCNPEYTAHALPQDHLVILMMYPLVHSIVYKALRIDCVVISWVVAIIIMFFAVWWADAVNSIPAIVVYIPLSALMLYENYRQDLILYFVVKRQRKLLAENKQMADDQATELRHMIANVAHDLKTVCLFLWNSF